MKSAAAVCVTAPEISVTLEMIAQAARSKPAKILALETGLSPSRIYDLRSARFGCTAAHLFALAQAYPPLARAVQAALSGEAHAGSAAAMDAIVRGLRK